MMRQVRISWPLALATAMLSAAGVEQAAAVTYKASLINFVGYDAAFATGISGTSIVGLGNPTSGGGLDALLLNTATSSVMSLNPGPGWGLQTADVSDDSQVGHGSGPTTGGDTHAILWHGTAASLVDLNPVGFNLTFGNGVSGNNQVGNGAGDATSGRSHALLWHGSAASVVDLHPSSGFTSSYANGVFGNDVVGAGSNIVGSGGNASLQSHALLWHGTAASVVDLHPSSGFVSTGAAAIFGDEIVGSGTNASGQSHALLWHGTAASVIDLHPAGFTQTGATGVAGALQVGYGQGAATGGQQHALLWAGSAASVVDLHALLVGLGPSFVSSYVYDIDASGVIVGSAVAAVGSNYVSYAVKWSPVVLGDYNSNGIVDAADYTVWRDTLGSLTDLRANGDNTGASAARLTRPTTRSGKQTSDTRLAAAQATARMPQCPSLRR